MEHKQPICSLESKLLLISICSVRIPSRNRDIFKKLISFERVQNLEEKYAVFVRFGDYTCARVALVDGTVVA